MSSAELKSELHRIIDKIDDNRILQAVHTLLEGQETISDGEPWNKKEIDLMLMEGEIDVEKGKLTDHIQLLQEINTWRKK